MSTPSEFTGGGSATFRDLCAGRGGAEGRVVRGVRGERRKEGGTSGQSQKGGCALDPMLPDSHKKLYGPFCAISRKVFSEVSVQDMFLEDEIQFCLETWPGPNQKWVGKTRF